MSASLYILVGKEPVAVNDFQSWATWFEWMSKNGGKHVADNHIPPKKAFRKKSRNKKGQRRPSQRSFNRINDLRTESVRLSTVFLGLDHDFFSEDDSKPIVFETLIFGGKYDEEMYRYRTWDEAKETHDIILTKLL